MSAQPSVSLHLLQTGKRLPSLQTGCNPIVTILTARYHPRSLCVTKHTGIVYFSIIDQMSCGSHDQASHYCRIFKLFLRNSLQACNFFKYLHCSIERKIMLNDTRILISYVTFGMFILFHIV